MPEKLHDGEWASCLLLGEKWRGDPPVAIPLDELVIGNFRAFMSGSTVVHIPIRVFPNLEEAVSFGSRLMLRKKEVTDAH